MCSSELECLQLISDNILDIKAFAYALAVGLVIFSILFVLNKILIIFLGKTL